MKKIVCDICGKDAVSNKKYKLPISFARSGSIDNCAVDRYEEIEPIKIDLCKNCEKKIADAINSVTTKK